MTSHNDPHPPPLPPPHMQAKRFRELGHRFIDWIADYADRLPDRPVREPATPGSTAARLPTSPPSDPGGADEWDAIFRDLDETVLPGLTHWQHPRFFAYFPCNASPPAILGELVSAGLNVNGMLWATSPAATEIETRMLDWCRELFGLPDRFASEGPGGGVIQGTASEATLLALVAARDRARAAGVPEDAGYRVLASDQAHSSVTKAAMIAGIAKGPEDHRGVTLVPTDREGRMDPAALRSSLHDATLPPPVMVAATMGTTATGAFDPIDAVAAECRSLPNTPWLHVDAAWAGAAMVCPEHRRIGDGLEHADSLCINPHKWLLTNFDCDLFWVADRRPLINALSITPEYLRTAESDAGSVIDYRDWQVPLGRRFRALKLWFVLRHYGAEGLRAFVREHIAWTEQLESRIASHPKLRLVFPRSLSLLCIAHAAGDDATMTLLDRLHAGGRFLLTPTRVPSPDTREPVSIIRIAIGATATRTDDVEALWDAIDTEASAIG